MKWQYLLIPAGIVLMLVGFWIAGPPSAQVYSRHISGMEQVNYLMSTDYPIGTALASLGVVMILVVIVWKYKSSKKNPR